jgi:LacI family transcriptional regulator
MQRNPHRRSQHIALAFPVGLAHLQPLVRGITDYARAHGTWTFTTNPETVTMPIQSLRGWRGHGVIAVILTPADARAAHELGMPVVTFAGALRDPGVPRVMVNNPLVGRLAADHLLACGFPRFGYYGLHHVRYSHDRGDGFLRRLAETGRAASVHLSRNTLGVAHPWTDEMQKLDRWLSTLEGPVGLFAANDMRARMLLDACQRIGRRVPDDVGVVGVDNDLVTCEFSDPPLSSIACDWYRIGVEAAAALDALLKGQTVAKEKLIDPVGVVKRRSSDVLIVDHPGVAMAIRYVHEHIAEPFGVERLIEAAMTSRRSLELSFKRSLGCTPHDFLCRERVAKAKELLVRPEKMKLSAVAAACGFTDARRLRILFERFEGVTPAAYRQRQTEAGAQPVHMPSPVKTEVVAAR